MAQSRVTSPVDIYDTLTGDTAFMSYVGEYNFTGNTIPIDSISIITPGQPLPEISSQSGLEVVIHDVGIITRRDYITSSPEALITYQLFLIVWPPADGITMNNAAKRIIEIFAGATSIQTVPTPNQLTTLVQTQILIPENAAILI